jgi:integrase
MKRGTGSLFRPKGSRYWYSQVYVGGKASTRSTGETEKAKAMRVHRTRLGDLTMVVEGDHVRLDHMIEWYLRDYEHQGRRSTRAAKLQAKNLRCHFGNVRAIDITAAMVDSFIDARRAKGYAAATIQLDLATLKRMFTLAVRKGRLTHRPHIPSMQVDNARSGFFEAADWLAVQGALVELDQDVADLMECLYLTGWRSGEATKLTWAQVDLDGDVLRLEPGTTKNKDGRAFPFRLYPQLRALFTRRRELTDRVQKERRSIIPWVFHRNGYRIRYYYGAWRAACAQAGVAGRIPHDFRRTAARNLEWAGVPRSWAMKLLGHKTESIYRRYAITGHRELEEGASRLSQFLAQQTGERKVRRIQE